MLKITGILGADAMPRFEAFFIYCQVVYTTFIVKIIFVEKKFTQANMKIDFEKIYR